MAWGIYLDNSSVKSFYLFFWGGVEDFKYDLGHVCNENAIWAMPIWIGIFYRGPSKPELSIKDDIYEHRKCNYCFNIKQPLKTKPEMLNNHAWDII